MQGCGGHWFCNPPSFCIWLCRSGPVGFQQGKYEGLQLFQISRSSWQWSRGLGAYNSDCLLHTLGTEHSRGSSPHLLHLCRKQIPTIEELNTLNHYKADGSYLCSPCSRWESTASWITLSRGCLAGSDAGCRLVWASAVLSTYMLSLCGKAKGKIRGNYVGKWNEQIGVGGGRTCVWDKGAGKC